MLPRITNKKGAALGVLAIICLICEIAYASDSPSNILLRKEEKLIDNARVESSDRKYRSNRTIPAADDTYQCFKCNRDVEDCEDAELVSCSTTEVGEKRCYIHFEKESVDVIRMGCITDFESEQDIISLVKEKLLYICDGDICNGFQNIPAPNECSLCNSDTAEICATTPTLIAGNVDCTVPPYTQCYQRVSNRTHGTTERGCLSSLEGDEFWNCLVGNKESDCKICMVSGCNRELIPQNRLKCHRCDSSNDASCTESSPSSLRACQYYNTEETCIASYDHDTGVTKRGCNSDLSCEENSRTCQKCKGDGCNRIDLKERYNGVYGLFQSLPLNCYHCEGTNCATGALSEAVCKNYAYQDCLTVFNKAGAVIQRGCELDVLEAQKAHCHRNPELCFKCKSNLCNTMTDAGNYQKCLFCDSSVNEECLFAPESVTSERNCVEGCVAALYPRKGDANVNDFVRTCFEDIETEDRPNCTAARNCVRCNDKNNCNTDILPERRLSCLHCNGADCNAAQPRVCAAYSDNDQCYMYFESKTNIAVRLGCLSDLSPGQVEGEIKQYFLCDGDNCNDFKNLPEARICHVCNSDKDVDCAVNLPKLNTTTTCDRYPYTECSTYIDKDGHTIRGCFYDMNTEDFVKCKNGDSGELCKICTEPNCNDEEFPQGRLSCLRCNSEYDPSCESEPHYAQICPIYKEEDSCVTQIIQGYTRRACVSDLPCGTRDRKRCQTCPGFDCNTVDLSDLDVGKPGQFQDLPLNCYHCDDKCADSELGVLRKCEPYFYQSCTVAFNSTGSLIGRGCSDTLEPICDTTGSNCFDCKSNGCNVAHKESDFIDCVFCDAQKNNDLCVFDVNNVKRKRKCYQSCMTALYPRTNDTEPVYELIRTCLDDFELDDRLDCQNRINCETCTTDRCNVQALGERKSCYHCKDANCQMPEKKTCRATMAHDQCFIQYDESGAIVQMGCKSQYDPPDVKNLLYAKRLWLCDEDNCNDIENAPSEQRCTICNSRTDPKCAIAPDELTGDTNCARKPYTQCYMRLDKNGHTERGCFSNLEGDEFYNCLFGVNGTDCEICVGENCNKKIYPADRRTCLECSSSTIASCENSPSSSEICFKPDEKCVTAIDGNGNTHRGCSSELLCDQNDSSNCRVCEKNDCNRINLKRQGDANPGLWQELPLKCYTCDNSADCANNWNAVECQNNEYCITVFGENGAVESRGCSDSIESKFGDYCDDNSANCHNCNSNNCNTATSLSDYIDCVYCDSATNGNCVNSELIRTRRKCNGACMMALYPKPNLTDVFVLTRSCLDDKDDVDREACKAGDEHCLACSSDGEACNNKEFPEDRWSCHVCTDDQCEDSKPQACKYYSKNERCFMLFASDNSILRKGCLSDLDKGFVSNNMESLFLCDEGSNCNSFENTPQPNECIECNSIDDPDCASRPKGVGHVATCSSLPNTQCYTQYSSIDGWTTRGCVSSLSKSERLECLDGNSKFCITCNKDACNSEIFPADRRQCHRCNSLDDPNCEHKPESESVCPYYAVDDYCGTKVIYGATYRGCSTDFKCDVTNYQKCRMCKTGDNCNTLDLKSIDIGEPGKWQDLPLNCYSCEGAECANGAGILRKCENDNLQNCGTVFDKDGSILQRGCSLHIYENETLITHCDTNPGLCKFCKSNGCNDAKSSDVYVDCIFCDGTENADCVRKVTSVTRRRSCQNKCFIGLYPRTDETNPAYELSRSCLDDLDLDERIACENGKNSLCKACEGESCNSIALPDAPRLKCLTCINGDCTKQISQECLAYRENDQCYALFDHESNKEALLGCASDLDNSQLIGNKRSLFLCNGDDCNQSFNYPNSTGCVICSSESCANCATDPKTSPDVALCEDLPYTQCVVYVDSVGFTHRGCFSDVNDDVFEECTNGKSGTCQLCDKNNCNNDVFPAGRRRCLRCDSRVNATCEESSQEFASLCPLYSENDYCVTKLEGSRTLRGCASDFNCNSSDTKACRTCDSDNCNTVNLMSAYIGVPGKWQDLPLSCHVCEGDDCTSGTESLQRCEGNNLQTCVTVFGNGTQSTVVKRGCSDQIAKTHADYCEENSNKCIGCKSNGCNVAQSLNDYTDCYFCDSVDGKHCSGNFDESTRTRKCLGSCMVALYPRSSSEDPAYDMSRSCLDDMELDDREKCENGTMDYCVTCEGARCNSIAVPEERHECLHCVDDDCEDVEEQECSAYHPNDQCYILYDTENNIANMGCRSDIEMDVITGLIKEKRLILCDGKNCNTPESVKTNECVVCDSMDDPRCATNPNLIEKKERCAMLPYTACGTRVNENGHTIRSCLTDFSSDVFYNCLTGNDSMCDTCSKDNCNGIDIFPADRLRCHQCVSIENENCESSPDSNRVCSIYDPDDTCITNLYTHVTYRSCNSTLECFDKTDKRNCRSCKASGCNTVDLVRVNPNGEPGKWQDVPLSCFHCDNEDDCVGGGRLRVCTDNIFQSCMTVFNVTGKVIKNGCSDAIEKSNKDYCSSNPNMCFYCNSNACNIATTLNDFVECLACDTDKDGNCVSNVKSITRTRSCYRNCMTALHRRDDEDNPAYHLARSCLDDMDIDEREDCIHGENEFCLACNGEKCNSADLPDKRLSCYMCEGENCQLPESKLCPFYRDNDLCYVLYDETNAISGMGCRSEYKNSDADYLFSQKRMHLCDGNNCNDIENLPVPHRCTICSSRTDVNCATNPETLSSNIVCNLTPHTDCYSRVLSDGSTERGCLSSLYEDDFLECVGGNSSSCNVCRGDGCNTRVFPEGRTKCHICDSSNEPLCEVKPDRVGICPKYDPEDTCVTTYLNGLTKRGCSSSLRCIDTNSKRCSKCSGDACNTINLARRQDDNYGKWQDLPLRCHVCTSGNCMSPNETHVETCRSENEQDCIVVFGSNGEVVSRGCEYDLDQEYGYLCDNGYCANCKSNECNTADSMDELTDCVYCDSSKDLNCIWQPQDDKIASRKCQGSCMTALYPAISGDNPIYNLIRTCLDDKESYDQTTCSKGRDAECTACEDGNCNVVDFPDDRISCYHCVGEDKCEDPVAMKCPQYKKKDQCFIMFDSSNSVDTMGCVSGFGNQDYETLIKTKRIYICDDGENCNSLDKVTRNQKCAVCNSKTDVLCAVNSKAVGTFEDCSMMPYTNCYSMLNDDGSTTRGCLSELPPDTFATCLLGGNKNCESCTQDGCNREVFPADRQQCYSCSSLDDPFCESFPKPMQPCPIVSETESCKTAISGNQTVRGCSSEVLCDATDSSTCRSCFGTSCNTIDLRNLVDDGYHGVWQDLPLKCHECIGEDCLASLGAVVQCTTNIEQDCKIVFEKDGNVRRRGCSDRVDDYEEQYCRLNPELCFTCKSNECNVAWSTDEFVECVFCNSTQDATCVIDPEDEQLLRRICYKDCMAAINSKGELIRSCLNDKEMFSQATCRLEAENSKECSSCSGEHCNNFNFPKDRRKCHVCNDSTCSETKSQSCLKYVENDSCFAKYENGRVSLMGCASSAEQSDLDEWKEQNSLYQCTDNDCNDFAKLPRAGECIACESSTTPECAQNPTQLDLFETCAGPNSQCVVHIDNAGNTLRGCASKFTQTEQNSCKNSGTCDICDAEKCNSEIFPTNRRRCHICSSLNDDGCVRSPNAQQICPVYAKNDRCISKFVEFYIERGCESSLKCTGTSTNNCQVCDGDACNTFEFSAAMIISGSLLFTSILAIIAMRGLMAH